MFLNQSKRLKITHSKTYMLKSIQLAIIQAFTALWKLKIELMVVILNPHQRTKRKVNICHVCIQPIFKSWYANDKCIQYIKRKFEIMGYAKLSNFFVLLQTIQAFWKTHLLYGTFSNQDLKMDLIHTWQKLPFSSSFD